jgi:hypothetical protein
MHALVELANARMPFGKYKDRYLTDLPEPYLVWFRQRGFPAGPIGRQLEAMYEIKLNGLEAMVRRFCNDRLPGEDRTH